MFRSNEVNPAAQSKQFNDQINDSERFKDVSYLIYIKNKELFKQYINNLNESNNEENNTELDTNFQSASNNDLTALNTNSTICSIL